MPPKDEARLRHMLEAAQKAVKIARFVSSALFQYAKQDVVDFPDTVRGIDGIALALLRRPGEVHLHRPALFDFLTKALKVE